MSDDEGDVHVCDICQEIFLGTDELEQHMKEDHADKEVGFLKQQISPFSMIYLQFSSHWLNGSIALRLINT